MPPLLRWLLYSGGRPCGWLTSDSHVPSKLYVWSMKKRLLLKKKSGWGHWRMAVWRQAETTDNLYAHKDPILFGEVILLAFLCCAESLIHVWLFVTPQTGPWQAPVSMGILQKRILEWVAMSSSRGSSWPMDWTQVSCIAGTFFTIWAIREA